MKKFYVSLLLVIASASSWAAGYEPLSRWMVFTGDYGYLNNAASKKLGFAGNQQVAGVVEMTNGSKAIATATGIFMFDGKEMTQLKMPADCFAASADITAIANDGNDGLWIATTMGLVKFDKSNFTNIPFESTHMQVVTDIAVTATGKVYISGLVPGEKGYVGGGVSFFNGAAWSTQAYADLPDSTLSGLALDGNGYLWALPGRKQDKGVARFDGKSWKLFNTAAGLPINNIAAITVDAAGKVWLASPKGIIESDNGGWAMHPFTNSYGRQLADMVTKMPDAMLDVTALTIEKNGTIWLGTRNSGLFSFANGGLKILTRENSPLASSSVLAVTIDKEGNKWVVAGYRNPDFAQYAMYDKRNRSHTPFTVAFGGVTAYCEHAKLYDNKWAVYDSTRASIDINSAGGIDEDKQGNIWFTDPAEGLLNYKDGKFTGYKHSNPMQTAFGAMYLAPDGKIFLAASIGGIKVFENGVVKDHAKNPAMGGTSSITYDKDGVLWAAGPNGVHKYANGEWETYKKGEGLPSIIVYSIFKDSKGMLWAGTGKGLVRFDTTWKEVGADVDFPSNDFTAIAEGSNGKMVLGTNKGISIYDGTTFTNITKIEALKINKFRVNAISIDKNNVAWIGTESDGILKFDGTNWTQYDKKSSGALYDRIGAIKMASDGKLYVSSESTSFAEFDPSLPSQDAMELARQDIAKRIKMAEPRRLFAVIQMQ